VLAILLARAMVVPMGSIGGLLAALGSRWVASTAAQRTSRDLIW
jgi:hypothetical protein